MMIEFTRKIFIHIKWVLKRIFVYLYCNGFKNNHPVNPMQIVFFSFQDAYTCNLKYICDEIIHRGKGYHIIWVIRDENTRLNDFPNGIKIVRYGTLEYYRAITTAKVFIANAFCFTRGYFSPGKEQFYFQTMHGSLGLKRIDSQAVNDKRRNKRAEKDALLTTHIFSNSRFETEVYESSFWRKEIILETGHARNDIFFWSRKRQNTIKKKVYEYFGIDENCKLAMFAPTVRLKEEKFHYEPIHYQAVIDILSEKFGGKWFVLYRKHHSTKNEEKEELPLYVINADTYPDIQELMIAIDYAITDYSSWIYDYVLTHKPGALYVPDLKEYDQGRGFYYSISEVPFPVTKSNDELIAAISAFNEDVFEQRVEAFLAKRGCIDDGNAASRIADLIESYTLS